MKHLMQYILLLIFHIFCEIKTLLLRPIGHYIQGLNHVPVDACSSADGRTSST